MARTGAGGGGAAARLTLNGCHHSLAAATWAVGQETRVGLHITGLFSAMHTHTHAHAVHLHTYLHRDLNYLAIRHMCSQSSCSPVSFAHPHRLAIIVALVF